MYHVMTTVPSYDSKCDLLIRAINTFPFFLLTPVKHDICKRVADVNRFNAETDPAFHFNADPDPNPALYRSGKSATIYHFESLKLPTFYFWVQLFTLMRIRI